MDKTIPTENEAEKYNNLKGSYLKYHYSLIVYKKWAIDVQPYIFKRRVAVWSINVFHN